MLILNYSYLYLYSYVTVADGADSYLYYFALYIAPLAAPAVALVSAFGMAMLYSSCSSVCVIPLEIVRLSLSTSLLGFKIHHRVKIVLLLI